jgi:hypothetical protein
MSISVSNCKKCQRVFQRLASDYCPGCKSQDDEVCRSVYKELEKTSKEGGIEIEGLAKRLNISVEDIEKYYFEGRLSKMGALLKIPCQSCKKITSELERKGYFCLACYEKTSSSSPAYSPQAHNHLDEEALRKLKELKDTLKAFPSHVSANAPKTEPVKNVSSTEEKIVENLPEHRQYGFTRKQNLQLS